MLTMKKCLRFNIILKLETIQGRIHRNKIKKSCIDDNYLFQSLYSSKVAKTIIYFLFERI